MSAGNAKEKIHDVMMNCEGVSAMPHRFGVLKSYKLAVEQQKKRNQIIQSWLFFY
ncbi:MAG: hypothetical protein ACM34N_15995 [Ignavibacteria bacterium]